IIAAADNKEFMGQLAQFSALEQMQNVASGLEKLASAQMMIHGSTLLGRTVEGRSMDDPSVIVSGEVTEVSFGSEGVVVSVDGSWVRLSDIIRLKATADA
ncbi:MAG: flagellar hook capping FlgD N-terminal domain-containing protein, partial [Bacillota bacterium]